MKPFKLAAGFILSALLFVGCTKTPEANFTSDKTTAETRDSIAFTNSTLHGDSYTWDFGDGTTSTSESTKKAYEKSGVYKVKMTATSKNGKETDVSETTVTITAANAKYAGSYTGTDCENDPVAFKVKKGSNDNEIIFELYDVQIKADVRVNNFTLTPYTLDNPEFGGKVRISGEGNISGKKITINTKFALELFNWMEIPCAISGTKP
jgi:PKD repeat protein